VLAAPNDPRAAAWFDAGVRASPALQGRSAAVVVGGNADAAAWAALGLARAIAPIRRVALGDLIGDAAPFAGLYGEPSGEGIVDSFLYGVSLNRIARELPGLSNGYLLPSGSEDIQREDVIGSDRWKRLAAGFAEVGAVLLLVTTADAPGLDALVEHIGGAICVGTDVLLSPTAVTLTTIMADTKAAAPPRAVAPAEEIVPRRPTHDFRAVLDTAIASGPAWQPPPPPAPSRARWVVPALLLAATAAGGGAMALWRARQAALDAPVIAAADSTTTVAPPVAPESTQAATPPADSVPPEAPPAVLNPEDSLLAAGWAVELVAANTEAGARSRLTDAQPPFPAGTWAPATIGTSTSLWFKAYAGALVTRPAAESLLVSLRRRKALEGDLGRVTRVPFAFRLAEAVPSDSVPAYLAGFSELGLPAYALRRPDGTADVLAGAFDSPTQAALHIPALRAAKVEPVLVFRTGRAF
jgi:hypothetical protein